MHDAAELLGELVGLLCGDGVEALLSELGEGVRVVAEVLLEADQEGPRLGAVMADLGVPLLLAVVERRGRHDGVAQEEAVCRGVRQGPQTVVLLLTRSIPQAEVISLPLKHNITTL